MNNSYNDLDRVFENLKHHPQFFENICHTEVQKSVKQKTYDLPSTIDPIFGKALKNMGIESLYAHQIESYEEITSGNNLVISTGTSSGKTLCFNLPVLNALLTNAQSSALYIYPTKSLTQDQYSKLSTLTDNIAQLDTTNNLSSLNISIYDGDTSLRARKLIQNNSRLILTNPDMIHANLLPNHHLWHGFLSNLEYIVIDEVHVYRGVFGSHVANVLRRLKRVLEYYGAKPQFIMASATIGNPEELCKKLIEDDVKTINTDGSPHNKRTYLLYNPPITDPELGVRRNPFNDIVSLAEFFIQQDIQTLIFTKTRKQTEVLVKNIRERNKTFFDRIMGYRSGYLAEERRKIERDLRSKKAICAVATNALELGIDIGDIQAIILAGYPGSISSTQQQFGRAGRGNKPSIGIFVATQNPLDQYLLNSPAYLFDNNPEQALLDPDNLIILYQHLKCSIYELPMKKGHYAYGKVNSELISRLLDVQVANSDAVQSNGTYYASTKGIPSRDIPIRNISPKRIIIQRHMQDKMVILGEIDEYSAYWMIHPNAVYLHNGDAYYVEDLDLEKKHAILKDFSDDYYTQPITARKIESLSTLNVLKNKNFDSGFGEVTITTQVTGYKKYSNGNGQVLGSYEIEMPKTSLNTSAYWMSLNDDTVNNIRLADLWKNDNVDYGADWKKIRNEVLTRDNHTCQVCGNIERFESFHVHHKIPIRLFSNIMEANKLNNLITLCPTCHKIAESNVHIRSGLSGFGYAFHHLVPIYLMCDSNDLGYIIEQSFPLLGGKPTVILHEQIPGGIGLCRHIYEMQYNIFSDLYSLINNCGCTNGCPSCVGPTINSNYGGKKETLAIINQLLIK